jgi:hypothetical protein
MCYFPHPTRETDRVGTLLRVLCRHLRTIWSRARSILRPMGLPAEPYQRQQPQRYEHQQDNGSSAHNARTPYADASLPIREPLSGLKR